MSFIHNASFHLDSMRKLTGVDLGRYNRKGKYLFLDGLSELFHQDRNTPNQDCLKLEPAGLSILTENVLTSILQMGSAGSKPFLVIENPDVLLSAGGVSSVDLLDLLLDWHELVESTILMVNADSALVSWAHSRIETEHAAFVITLAHQASSVSSLRMLDTGLAKDVSGVLRITTSDKTISDHWDESKRDEKEVLYLVKDGLVEVFNRGQMCA